MHICRCIKAQFENCKKHEIWVIYLRHITYLPWYSFSFGISIFVVLVQNLEPNRALYNFMVYACMYKFKVGKVYMNYKIINKLASQ